MIALMSCEDRFSSRCCVETHDLRHLDRLAAFIADRHLTLGVGPERLCLARTARLRHQLENAVSVVDRSRHQFGCLAARVAEHDALVAGALVLVAGRVDALRNVGRLRVQMNFDARLLPMKAGLLVSDVLDCEPGHMGEIVARQRRRPAGFAGNDDAIGGRKRLAGDAHPARVPAEPGRLVEKRIDDFIGNAIAHLVRMAFGYQFAGEKKTCARHLDTPARGPRTPHHSFVRPAFLAVSPCRVKGTARPRQARWDGASRRIAFQKERNSHR